MNKLLNILDKTTIIFSITTIILLLLAPMIIAFTMFAITLISSLLSAIVEFYVNVNKKKVYFSKVREDVVIPSKLEENAGYDVYANFKEDYMVIAPHETKMIPTGIASACSSDYYFQLFERGSTGTKGIAQRCGVIDSGYRNEWFVPITNTTNKVMFISKLSEKDTYSKYYNDKMTESFVYPYEKGICQAVLLPVPKVNVNEISYEDLCKIKSNRGMGKLGSSHK